jgi:hypothetical protein
MKLNRRIPIAIGLAVLIAVGLVLALKNPFISSLESGYYLVAEKEFVGPKDQVKEYKEDFLFGQLMDQMEHQEDVVYAVYDKTSKTLKVHTLDEIAVYQVNEEDVSFEGPSKETETLLKLKGSSFTIQDRFIDDIKLNIRMDKVEDNNPKIVEYKQLIEAEKIAKAEQQAKYKEQLSTPAEGIKIRVGDTEMGVVMPIWAKFIESKKLKSGATRYTFKDSEDVFSEDLQLFLATTPEQVKKLQSDLFYTDKDNIIFEDGSTQLVEDFEDYISVSKIETQEGTLFSYGTFEDQVKSTDWVRVLKSAKNYEKIDAPTLADLIEKPEVMDQLVNISLIGNDQKKHCKQELKNISHNLIELLKPRAFVCSFISSKIDPFYNKNVEIEVEFSLSDQNSKIINSHSIRDDNPMSDEEKSDIVESLYVSEDVVINKDDFFHDKYNILQKVPIKNSGSLIATFKSDDFYSSVLVIQALKDISWNDAGIPEHFNQHLGKYVPWFTKDDSEYFTIITNSGLEGIIKKNGDILVPVMYEDIEETKYGFIVKTEDQPRKFGIYKKDGDILLPVEFASINWLNEDFLKIKTTDGAYKLFNIKNEAILPGSFKGIDTNHDLENYNKNYITVQNKNNLRQIYDLSKNKTISIEFKTLEQDYYLEKINPNYFQIKLIDGKNTIYDLKNKKHISDKFDEIDFRYKSFTATMKNNDLYVFLKEDFSPLIDERFSYIKEIDDENFIVRKGTLYGIIKPSKNNHIVLEYLYDKITPINKNKFWAKKNNKWGMINLQGDNITPFKYTNISNTQDSFSPFDRSDIQVALVQKDEKIGVINWYTGEELTPIDFHLKSERPIILKKDNIIYRYPWDFIPGKENKPNRFHRASPASS